MQNNDISKKSEKPKKSAELWDITKKSKILLVVACALIDTDGRVLMTSRPKGKQMAGMFEFPGGKIEQFETPQSALIRELNEELGICTKESCLAPIAFASHPYPDFHLLMPLFACRVWSGIASAKEGQQLRWSYPNEIKSDDILPADVGLVAIVRDLLME